MTTDPESRTAELMLAHVSCIDKGKLPPVGPDPRTALSDADLNRIVGLVSIEETEMTREFVNLLLERAYAKGCVDGAHEINSVLDNLAKEIYTPEPEAMSTLPDRDGVYQSEVEGEMPDRARDDNDRIGDELRDLRLHP